jgi:hypothetical protein
MEKVLKSLDAPLEQELEAAFARMFRPEEGTKAQAWVNWLDEVRCFAPNVNVTLNPEFYALSIEYQSAANAK